MNDNHMQWLDYTLAQISETAKAKNADYSAGDDWKGNFKRYGLYGLIARAGDKYQRMEKLFLGGDAQVKDESVSDTLMDLSTYALLIKQANEEGLTMFGDMEDMVIEYVRLKLMSAGSGQGD